MPPREAASCCFKASISSCKPEGGKVDKYHTNQHNKVHEALGVKSIYASVWYERQFSDCMLLGLQNTPGSRIRLAARTNTLLVVCRVCRIEEGKYLVLSKHGVLGVFVDLGLVLDVLCPVGISDGQKCKGESWWQQSGSRSTEGGYLLHCSSVGCQLQAYTWGIQPG